MEKDIKIVLTNDDALRVFCVDEKVRILRKLTSKCRFCDHKIRLGNAYCDTCLKDWLDKPYAI